MGTRDGFPNPPAMGSGGGPASAPRVVEMPKSRILIRSPPWPDEGRQQEHVLRMDVAVNDPLRMRGRQRRAHLLGQVGDALERHRSGARDDLAQRFALEVLHHQKRRAIRQGVEVDDRDDAGMAQPGHHLRLAHESRQRLRLIAHVGANDLHGVANREALVGGFVDLAHSAAANEAHDAVCAAQKGTELYTGRHGHADSSRRGKVVQRRLAKKPVIGPLLS